MSEWRVLIDAICTPASVDGYSICEKKLRPKPDRQTGAHDD